MGLIEKIEALPVKDALEAGRAAQAEFFRGSLYLTAKFLCGYREVNHETHDGCIRKLESSKVKKLVVMPRGTFKTSLAVVAFTIWCLIRDPNIRILIDSELYTNSKNSLREIKQHLMSPKLVELFGKFETRDCWNEGEIIIGQRTRVLKEASVTGSGIGAQKTGQHYDLIIADDMNSPKNSNTPEGCQKVIDHYRYYTSILEPHGVKVIIGTRYSESDLIGHIIRHEIMAEDG